MLQPIIASNEYPMYMEIKDVISKIIAVAINCFCNEVFSRAEVEPVIFMLVREVVHAIL